MNYKSLFSLLILTLMVSACVARSDIILPSKYDREAAISGYKACVTAATTNYYDDVRTPEEIVTASFAACRGKRTAMVRSYPRSWGASLVKDVDEKLYKSEIAWILDKRN